MDIVTELIGDETHVVLSGRLDAAWSNAVNQALQNTVHSGSHHIALNLANVDYLSSAGIRVLVILAKHLQKIGGRLRLADASPAVREVLQLVGFHQLLAGLDKPPVEKLVVKSDKTAFESCEINGIALERYLLNADALQQVTVIDNSDETTLLEIGEGHWAIGHGCLGADSSLAQAGELLAVDGLAVCLPGDDPQHPDWLSQEGGLVPRVGLVHGLYASGTFRYLLRFGLHPDTPPLRLSELAQMTLACCECDTVAWVMIAETAHLIGAALQVSASARESGFFNFPSIRDRLLFTAEPAFADETCVVAGVIARDANSLLAKQLRPYDGESGLAMHHHAGVMPFMPVRKGLIELSESLQRLMDTQTVRGVLHLLNDDREGVGAGESFLRRGAIWCAPVVCPLD
ncbi:STAS domain-containing protein [Methylocucumis oryzae]|uniref:STAS domain-containing protein n=1 Tax=Methylocucumis oryzae TaxID=1632867 RepID=UPI0006987255|nr:STAS domain-containing protein [Methylocucumis oryzae]